MATWRSKEDPTGYTVNLGKFSRTVTEDFSEMNLLQSTGSFVLGIEKMQQDVMTFDDEEDSVDVDLTDSKDIFIRFEVYHEDKLLGSMVQQAINFVSLKNSLTSKQVLLLLPKEKEPEKEFESKETENTM